MSLGPFSTNAAVRFVCGCNISWLVRDNPALLDQVNNGTCTDGRPFGSIPAEEVSCCKAIGEEYSLSP